MNLSPKFNIRFAIPLFFLLLISTRSQKEIISMTTNQADFFNPKTIYSYADGTLLIEVVNEKLNNTLSSVLLLFPNGTNSKISLDFFMNEKTTNFTKVWPLMNSFFFAQYHQLNSDNSVNEFGVVMNWNGDRLLDVNLGSRQYNESTIAVSITSNIKPEAGFLVAWVNTAQILWSKFSSPILSGNITKISDGFINAPINTTFVQTGLKIFGTIEGSYGIVYNQTINTPQPTIPNKAIFQAGPKISLQVAFLKPASADVIGPMMIYYTRYSTSGTSQLIIPLCTPNFNGQGNICTIYEVSKSPLPNGGNALPSFPSNGNQSPDSSPWAAMKITFLSTGAVTRIEQIGMDGKLIPPSYGMTTSYVLPIVTPLYYGGDLVIDYFMEVATSPTDSQFKTRLCFLVSSEFADGDKTLLSADWPKTLTNDVQNVQSGLLPNNSAWVSVKAMNGDWKIVYTSIKKYIADAGYQNPQVQSSSVPPSTIISYTNHIDLTFKSEPIAASSGKLSIYQVNNDTANSKQLRQSIPGDNPEFCAVLDNKATISCEIFLSTFNQIGTSYMITIENNFVKNALLNEALPGIKENVWIVTTSANDTTKNIHVDSVTGLLRLSKDGTNYYTSLPSSSKPLFISTLQNDLIQSISIDPSRIKFTNRVEPDKSVNPSQLLFQLQIIAAPGETEMNVDQIIDNLNSLVKHKQYTMLETLSSAKYLDEAYQFHKTSSFWDEIKFILLGFLIAAPILGGIFFWARKRCDKGKNFVFVSLLLIIFGFVNNVLFIANNGKDVERLFVPSIVILSLSLGLNSSLSTLIYIKEYSENPKFQTWFTSYNKLASIFTILGWIDVNSFEMINSQFAGFEIFNAGLSSRAENWIFWGNTMNIVEMNIVEMNIPWTVIQILYHLNTVTYKTVPTISLVTSVILLCINIISRIYDILNRYRKSGKVEYDSPSQQQTQQTQQTQQETQHHEVSVQEDQEEDQEDEGDGRVEGH